jgi:antitoxin MazE
MHAKLIDIGNSRGVRLPKTMIEQAGLGEELDLEVRDGAVVIRNADVIRKDWAQAAVACHEADEDVLDDWDATAADGDWS